MARIECRNHFGVQRAAHLVASVPGTEAEHSAHVLRRPARFSHGPFQGGVRSSGNGALVEPGVIGPAPRRLVQAVGSAWSNSSLQRTRLRSPLNSISLDSTSDRGEACR